MERVRKRIRKIGISIFVLLLALSFSSCKDGEEKDTAQVIQDLKQEIDDLKKEIEQLKKENRELALKLEKITKDSKPGTDKGKTNVERFKEHYLAHVKKGFSHDDLEILLNLGFELSYREVKELDLSKNVHIAQQKDVSKYVETDGIIDVYGYNDLDFVFYGQEKKPDHKILSMSFYDMNFYKDIKDMDRHNVRMVFDDFIDTKDGEDDMIAIKFSYDDFIYGKYIYRVYYKVEGEKANTPISLQVFKKNK